MAHHKSSQVEVLEELEGGLEAVLTTVEQTQTMPEQTMPVTVIWMMEHKEDMTMGTVPQVKLLLVKLVQAQVVHQ